MPDVLNVVSKPLWYKRKPKAFARAKMNMSLDSLYAQAVFLCDCKIVASS